jgi:hypothetical protein
MRQAVFPCLLLSTLLAACSSSSSSGGSGGGGNTTSTSTGSGPADAVVTGTILGRSLSPAYAVAVKGIEDPAYPNEESIIIADTGDLCSFVQNASAVHKANLLDLVLVLGETEATGPAVTPGTYTPSTMPDELTASYDSFDANCMDMSGEQTGGSVTITSVGDSFKGTFDVTFGSDHVTGSFTAPVCVVNLDGGMGVGGAVCEM